MVELFSAISLADGTSLNSKLNILFLVDEEKAGLGSVDVELHVETELAT